MKKITLSLVFLLAMIMGSYGQVSYEFGWEPTTAPMGGWTTTSSYGFSRQTVTPCAGLASVRANTYSSATSTLTSPLLPNSNGGIITLNFDYKVTLYNPNTTGAPANQVDIEVQTSNSATGPWIAVEYINENNHTVSATCAAKTFSFSALPGDFYLRFVTKAINGADVYYYFDNVSITQGVAPSCIPPAVITASAITSNSATITWGAASPVPSGGYEYYVSTSNDAPPASGTVSAGLTANLTSLLDNTVQYVWVRSMCDSGSSVWNGPITFKTLCVPFGDFNENFDTSTAGTGLVPSCWNKVVVSTTTFANVSVINNTASSTPNAISMTNSDDANAQLYLVTPSLSAIGANTHRMKFKARGGSAGQILSVGTMSNPNDPSTYVELQSYTLTAAYATYNVTLNTSTTANFVAFKHGLGGTYRTVYLDDMIWEPIPTEAPGCIEDMNAVINEGCGNFPTTFTWAAVPGSDGYKVSIGTSANGADLVVSNLDIFSALNYSFVGNPGTTYYYTIRPYNANGSAVDCYEDTFTTYDDGCYCVALPTSNDGAGISSVQINDVVTPVTDVFYANFTENGAIDITQGVNTIMNVTLATSYGYWTDVWVDYNDNYTFEASELVYSSTAASSSTNPTIVNTSFMTSLTAPIGEHRMRIVSSDSKKNPANPCYSSSYGVALDFLVNVTPAPDCLPPTASTVSNITADGAQLNWISEGTLFNVETLFAGESQGSGSVTSGIAANTLTLTGLDPQTNYEYYVQTDCGNGSLSPWTGPFSFRTGCESFGGFTENFTTDVSYIAPECWYTKIVTTGAYAAINVYNYNDYVILNNSDDAAAQLYLITPSLTDLPLNTHRVKFRSYSPTQGGSVIVGTISDPADVSTFTAVQTIPLTTAFADYSVAFNSSTTASHIAFKFVGTGTYQSVYIDDVIWEVAPSCPDVYVVNFTGATSATADITWTPGGSEITWQYAYGSADLTSPEGLTTYDVATTPSVTITGLAPSTNYKVWIRSSCGAEFGQWSPARSFLTACLPVTTFPWVEGFEGITPGFNVFPLCWSKENGDYSTANTGSSTYNTPRTGSNYLRNSWSAANEYMWTPGFDLTAGVSYDFSFFMQGDGFTGWTVDVMQNSVQNSTGATQLGATETASGTGTYVVQPYALVSRTFVPTTSGTFFFAVRVNQPSGSPWYIAFDDFRMEPTPTCVAPLAPTATNQAVTTATINWIATSPAPVNGYDYYVSSTTVLPTAATTPTGSVGAGVTTANLTELVGSTVYKIYVRSICGADDKSSWSDAGTFTTTCITAVLPYTINFESVTTPNLPLCTTIENAGTGNNWKTESLSLYGFSSKVLSYTYSSNPANAWFYTNTVSLVAGTTYTVSYDYGTNSTATWSEKLKVSYGATGNSAAMTTEIANHPMIQGGNLQSNVATFTPATSGDYVIGFNAYSTANQYYLYVDNIVIQDQLGSADFDKNSFTAYPNPVKDVLNVSFNQNISNLTVYNLLGQQVLFMNMNASKGQVDMSALATGTYLVKVNTENGLKTIKVIKE